MGNGNGYTKWLVGVLFTVLFTAFTTLTSHVIANDEKSRQRDDKLQDKLIAICGEQQAVNQQILLALQDIKTEQRVTKEMIKRNGS